MATTRALYLTFYILYLLTLAVALWLLLFYSGVPGWVYLLFGIAILLVIINTLLKEFLLTRTITTTGRDITSDYHSFWSGLYILIYIIAFVLVITGIVFVVSYSSIPWWVWVVLGIAILLSFLSDTLVTFSLDFIAVLTAIAAFILFVIGFIFLVIYSNAPWWVWIIIGLAILFAILAAFFQGMAEKNILLIHETYTPVVQPVVQVQPQLMHVQPVPPQVQPIQHYVVTQ